MTYELIQNDGTTIIKVNFADEGVELTGETSVIGDESSALAYVHVFESDLRRNFAEKFPTPEQPEVTE
jgi:hypothetical protein